MKRILLGLTLLCSFATAANLPSGPLTLGQRGLSEQRQAVTLLPGVTLTTITRGQYSTANTWTVNIAAVADKAVGDKQVADLKAAGFDARLDPMQTQGVTGAGLGYMVRVGHFTARAQADNVLSELKARKLSGGVQFTGEDGGTVTGPWVIQVLAIQPGAQAQVRDAIAKDLLPGREATSSVAHRLGAVAAVNGGFFVTGNDIGTEGDLAGISVNDGQLLSEAIDGRPAFLLDRSRSTGKVLQGVTTTITVRAGDASRRATGLNRKPGLIVNCGNFAGKPTVKPAHDLTCQSDNELIVFRAAAFGEQSDAGDGFEVAVDGTGTVTATQEKRGMAIPKGGLTVQATGDAAPWLKANAQVGRKLSVSSVVTDGTGKEVALAGGQDLINGGPTLLLGGRLVNNYAAEGWSPEGYAAEGAASAASRLNFYNGWVLRRNPRTAVGTMPDGTLLLVTIDGRNATHSVGASIPEMAQLMKDLGATDAMNLDGGGSTATYVNGLIQGVPSDAAGERPDGDAIVVLPR